MITIMAKIVHIIERKTTLQEGWPHVNSGTETNEWANCERGRQARGQKALNRRDIRSLKW